MIKLWGVSVSYFTGKIEAYLRYKRIGYEMQHPFRDHKRIREAAGAIQVPMIERDDGRWMSDSTYIIQAMEREHVDRPVMPSDPVVRFIALLIEDYGDEWLWRAAMHYRWSYDHDRELISRVLADEVTGHVPLPRMIRRMIITRRQQGDYVIRDGIDHATRDHAEAGYFKALECMSALLAERPFMLGNTPSVADYGLMGPMFRHFGQDPTPAYQMRYRAPAVFEWVARMWNAGAITAAPAFVTEIPVAVNPLLREIVETHLVQLRDNAAAFVAQKATFDMTVQGCHYRAIPTSQYRVYALERLREEFAALDDTAKAAVRALLDYPDAELLWDAAGQVRSGYDEARNAPFNKSINVFQDKGNKGLTKLARALSK